MRLKYSGKYFLMVCVCIVFICADAGRALAANPQLQEDRAEIFLRALLDVGDQTIKSKNQHCNLGHVYLTKINPDGKEPIKIKEPLLAEIAQMSAGGNNKIAASCDDKKQTQCYLELSHAKGEEVSSTKYQFLIEDEKIETDTLECISTP